MEHKIQSGQGPEGFSETDRLNFQGLHVSVGSTASTFRNRVNVHQRANGGKDFEYFQGGVRESSENGQVRKECLYFQRTGFCKYGDNCRYRHSEINRRHTNTTYAMQLVPRTSWPSPAVHPLEQQQNPVSLAYIPGIYSPECILTTQAWSFYQGFANNPSSATLQQHPYEIYNLNQNFSLNNSYLASGTMGQQSQHAGPLSEYQCSPYSQVKPSEECRVSRERRNSMHPQRHGQQECEYYLRTGTCRFGTNCKFRHVERSSQMTPCDLSEMGLPLRPSRALCLYYSRHGICKYGPACKYHHPIEALRHCYPTDANFDPLLDSRDSGSVSHVAYARDIKRDGGDAHSDLKTNPKNQKS